MNTLRKLMQGLVSSALLALLSFAWPTDTMAEAQQVAGEMEEVVVVEAPIMRSWTERGRYGGKVEVIELTRRVNYADLDLSKPADVTTLETRIETTAKESCEALSDMFPLDPSDNMEILSCTKKAVNGTKKQVEAAIAASQ
jgi:UrcA family protein